MKHRLTLFVSLCLLWGTAAAVNQPTRAPEGMVVSAPTKSTNNNKKTHHDNNHNTNANKDNQQELSDIKQGARTVAWTLGLANTTKRLIAEAGVAVAWALPLFGGKL